MKIEILSKNYNVSDKLKNLIEKKLEKLDNYFPAELSAKFVIKSEGNGNKTELTVYHNKMNIRAEVSGDNVYDLLDLIIPKIEKQLEKYKTKVRDKKREMSSIKKNENKFEQESLLVKKKRFELEELTVDDAILQLELLDHDFFVYKDLSTKQVNIVYKRTNGDYGLIETF